jgi:hypothetical protein
MKIIIVLFALLWALPVRADPIFATLENRCVPFASNAEVFWWSTAPFDFASFRSDQAGCDATIDIPTTAFERIDNFNGVGGLAFRVSSDMVFPLCGRAQWDAWPAGELGNLLTVESYLIVDLGVDCAPMTVTLPPVVPFLPPDVLTDTPLPPGVVSPPTFPTEPPSVPIPEPGTLVLLGAGLAFGLRRMRR